MFISEFEIKYSTQVLKGSSCPYDHSHLPRPLPRHLRPGNHHPPHCLYRPHASRHHLPLNSVNITSETA